MNDESVGKLIDYLLKRQFGTLAPPPAPTLRSSSTDRGNNSGLMGYGKIQARRAELEAMPLQELKTLTKNARLADAEARDAKLKKEESELFFNRPSASADMAYCAKLATWSLDEAVALSLGKAPGVVHPQSMETERFIPEAWSYSSFPREYSRCRELVRRAHRAYELDEPTKPAAFLAWAKNMEMAVPSELASEVAKRTPILDLRRELETARSRIAELERELAVAREANAHQWPWGTHETKLLRKLAAAVQRFWVNYDPAEPSTANTSETVKGWLKKQDVPDRVAEVMAQIIRADGLRTGPR